MREDILPKSTEEISSPTRLVNRIFCNRPLNLENIEWIGFDMDYTLVVYRQAEMDRLSIDATIEKLIKIGYPDELRNTKYDATFPIRGLVIDKKLGNILKLDRHRYVKLAYHGTTKLSREARRSVYDIDRLRLATDRYHWVDTLYALSEVAIFATAVTKLDSLQKDVNYFKLFSDVRQAIDLSHQDGSILDHITSDFPRYIEKDPALAETLHRLRSRGKKIFVLTNSYPEYTDRVMNYLLDGELKEYSHWTRYFDRVVTGSRKPHFFTDKAPFERWKEGEYQPATQLKRGDIYFRGNIQDFQASLGVTGDRVLYIGDHIYGDVLRAKKGPGWRTAMVIQELENELQVVSDQRESSSHLLELERKRERVLDRKQEIATRYRLAKKGDSDEDLASLKKKRDETREMLSAYNKQIDECELAISKSFHPFWGSLLKPGGEISIFGKQVEDWACIYTSRVTNLRYYSALHAFRSPRDLMVHETLAIEEGEVPERTSDPAET